MSSGSISQLSEKIELVKGLFIATATQKPANNEIYKELRKELMASKVKDHLPISIKYCENLTDFWNYIQPMHTQWADRREHIRNSFDPLLTALKEAGANGTQLNLNSKVLIENQKKKKILVLAANPLDATRVRLDKEVRTIEEAIREGEHRDKIEVVQQGAVKASDLQGHLLRHSPNLMHFCGHGTENNEIILEDDHGDSHPVPKQALGGLFGALGDEVQCVVLNSCHSDIQAQAIAEHIECVIGMSSAIEDEAAINFSKSFYRALAYGRDMQNAFDQACNQLELLDLEDKDLPKLYALRSDPSETTFINNQ